MSVTGRGGRATIRMLAAVWIGGLWVLGCVVAPLLFTHLPLEVAGGIAGRLFIIWQGAGLVVAAIIFLTVRQLPRPWPLLAATVWGLDAVFELGILPAMVWLRRAPHFGPASPLWTPFLVLHTLAVALYSIEGILGLALIGMVL